MVTLVSLVLTVIYLWMACRFVIDGLRWLWELWLRHGSWLLAPFFAWTGLGKTRGPKT